MADKDERITSWELLYGDMSAHIQALSERQYTVTVSVLTLHLAILAGLVAYPIDIRLSDRLGAFCALTILDVFVIQYICDKCRSYWKVQSAKDELTKVLEITAGLSQASHSKHPKPIENQLWDDLLRGGRGSLWFISVIVLLWCLTIFKISMVEAVSKAQAAPASNQATAP